MHGQHHTRKHLNIQTRAKLGTRTHKQNPRFQNKKKNNHINRFFLKSFTLCDECVKHETLGQIHYHVIYVYIYIYVAVINYL